MNFEPVLILPDTHCLPDGLGTVPSAEWSANSSESELETLTKAMGKGRDVVEFVIGSQATPGIYWLAALKAFPEQTLLLQAGPGSDGKDWQDARTGDPWGDSVRPPFDSPIPIATNTPRESSDAGLLGLWFQTSLESSPSKSQQRLGRIEKEIFSRQGRNPQIGQWLQRVKAISATTINIRNEFFNRLRTSPQDEKKHRHHARARAKKHPLWVQAAINEALKSLPHNVPRRASRPEKRAHPRPKTKSNGMSVLPALKLGRGPHPNQLRHLRPEANWTVIVDETGSKFEQRAIERGHLSSQLGRFVAIVIPDSEVQKGQWPAPCHAVALEDPQRNQLLHGLMKRKIGIFGISILDPAITARKSWFSGLVTLLRMVCREIPLTSLRDGVVHQITIHIENRAPYHAGTDARILRDMLVGDLQGFDYSRYERLKLEVEFTDKNAPGNAWADIVAHTWNAATPNARTRLKHSRLEGHCLLSPLQPHVTRCLLETSKIHDLESDDWWELIGTLPQQPEGSLVRDTLTRYGDFIGKSLGQWEALIDEVQVKLRQGSYDIDHMAAALEWLEQHKPLASRLPLTLELEWRSARLAVATHLGSQEDTDLARCQELSTLVMDEDARLALEADIRVAESLRRSFRFKQAEDVLRSWEAVQSGYCGLTQWIALRFKLARLAACQGNGNQAREMLGKAVGAIDRISDSNDKKKLTNLGLQIALLLDTGFPTPDRPIRSSLEALLGTDLILAARQLAESDYRDQSNHHLFLRTMISCPEEFTQEREAYLAAQEHWEMEDWYPWYLIEAYRGKLLWDQGKRNLAGYAFERAIEMCFAETQGDAVEWAGLVLHRWMLQFGYRSRLPGEHQWRDNAIWLDDHYGGKMRLQDEAAKVAHDTARDDHSSLIWLSNMMPLDFH